MVHNMAMVLEYFNNLEKRYKLAVLFIILFVVLFIIYHFSRPSLDEELKNYLIGMGYKNDSGFYSLQLSGNNLDDYLEDVDNKINSSYEVNYFDTNNLLFKKNKRDYVGGMDSVLNENFNYKDMKAAYSYRVVLNEEGTFIFSGNYSFNGINEVFTCDKEYVYQFDLDDDDEMVCDKLKYDVKDFYYESLEFLSDGSILNKIINNAGK